MRKIIIWIIVIVAVGVGAFFGIRRFQQSRSAPLSQYQTATLQKGNLTVIVGATGTVRTNQTAVIPWQTSGRIESINVSQDSQVEALQVMATLAKDSLSPSLIAAEGNLITAKQNLANILDSDVARAQAQQTLVQAQQALTTAQNNRDSLDYKRATTYLLDQANASYILAKDAVKSAQKVYNDLSHLPEDNVNRASALSRLGAAKQQLSRAEAQLNYLLSNPTPEDIALADAKVQVAQANLQEAQRQWDKVKNGPNQDDVAAGEANIASIQATLDMAQLTAPFTGTVTQVYSKVGDLVAPGTVSFQIDDLTHLLIDVQIPEVDITEIAPGEVATIVFDAIPNVSYKGKVIDVSKVGTSSSTGVNYPVTVELQNADKLVLAGMTAAINITVQQLNDVLLIPNQAVRFVNNTQVVYIIRNDTLMEVQILIGATSSTYSQVLAGEIQAGDQVVLNPPSTTTLPGGSPFGG
jgi:HlyD family secretion protein